ncbi:carbohydrate kinase family protein [Pseudactinotalea sp. HY158]|uniref:carbohydrate kinase family protein n=1 Tax=Pseudactinotalea sp. HY158 TaxID=2654547 RepID=UPI00129CC0BA|nr:carbohydrate kinase family protein [Pseudactinotalea sp. HY158]QGH70300.1 hypothetical protein GCE65_12950 [Pseudactinotalea sp. HY158]
MRTVGTTTLEVIGGLTLDSVISSDGTYVTDSPGGNALWAAAGAVMLGADVALHTVAGRDYDPDVLTALAAAGMRVDHVRRDSEIDSTRVTFAYELDGERIGPAPRERILQLPRSAQGAFVDTTLDPAQVLPTLSTPADLARSGRASHPWHMGLLPVSRFGELVTYLAGVGAPYVQADCPSRHDLLETGIHVLDGLLEQLDVFLPSTSDSAVFDPDQTPLETVAAFRALGARTTVLKDGAAGAWIAEGDAASMWHVPAYRGHLVRDPTGAGDVFCGAFATAVVRGDSLLRATCAASACASFATTVLQPLELLAVDPHDIESRTTTIEKGARRL